MTYLEHRGYAAGPITFDHVHRVFTGEVAGLRAVVTFTGRSGDELVQAFRDSVDDYLSWCAERGEQPEEAYSGRFLVRVDPALHRKAAIRAAAEELSLNAWIAKQIEAA
jgi:predicted HicB family RNase H-like nuclease